MKKIFARVRPVSCVFAIAFLWLLSPQLAIGAPTLNIARSGGNVILSWSSNGFALQSTASLTPPAWVDAGLTIIDNGDNHSATAPIGPATKFFRLFSTGLPAPPTGLVLVPYELSFFLDWNASAGATSYNVYLASVPGVTRSNYLSLPNGQKITGVTHPYFLSGLISGMRYYLVVTAVNAAGESGESSELNEVFGPHGEVGGSIYAQFVTGTTNVITNRIFIPNLSVTLMNVSNSLTMGQVQTDLAGGFTFPNVAPGLYRVCYSNSFCFSGCSTQQFTVSNQNLSLPALAVTPSCSVAFGQVILGGNNSFQRQDSFFGLNILASVKAASTFGTTNVTQVNSSGEFLFTGLSSGSYTFIADCEGAHVQQTMILPTNGPIILTLSNNVPRITAAYAQDISTGLQIHRANPGATVRLTLETEDINGDMLTYQWFPGLGDTTFVSSNSPTVLWQLPNGSGVHMMYFSVRDNKGGVATDKIIISTDPSDLFSGSVTENGIPLLTTAVVTVNGQTVLSDSNGYFSMPVTNLSSRYVLNISAPGYEPISRIFLDAATEVAYSLHRSHLEMINASMATSITDTVSGATIDLPANAFVDEFGNPYSGTVALSFSGVNVADPTGRLPGNGGGVDEQGTNVSVTTYSAVYLFAQTGGVAPTPLGLATGADVFVGLPFGQVVPQNMFTPLPLWYYDYSAGFFRREIGFTFVTNRFRWRMRRTGLTACGNYVPLTNGTACVKLEIDPSINLPVSVWMREPTRELKLITEPFTTINNLPPNTLATFQIFSANNITLTGASCIISNAVNTGPANPLAPQGSNCVAVKLAFPGIPIPNPGDMLNFKFRDGDAAYAQAYYKAIDPNNSKPTLERWLATNGFGSGPVTEAIYFNNGDLGFGRWMGMATNANGDIAYYVSNYKSADAAIAAKRSGSPANGLIATVCMEYSASTQTNAPANRFTKFYVYDAKNQRVDGADLDGRGFKYVPNLCLVCHGGKVPPTNPGTGDLKAKFIPFDLESFRYSSDGSFTQAAQESAFRTLTLTTLRAATTPAITDLVQGWYAGTTFKSDYVPGGWTGGQINVYNNVFKPSCRACHVTREAVGKDLNTYDDLKFNSLIDNLVFKKHTMPNALRTYNIFWGSQCSAIDQPLILTNVLAAP